MNTEAEKKLHSGNWVSLKIILIPGMIGIIFTALGLFSWPWFAAAAVFLGVSIYFLLARRLFSPGGGNIQEKVFNLLMSEIQWSGTGEVLDIGCGSGVLTIRLADTFRNASITGTDTWGAGWDYSRQLCEENARLSGAGDRLRFIHGSASSLPFEDESFDLVVSNLVFHEVKGVRDKTVCLKEALRVLKPGGVFVLQDLFLLKSCFGPPETLVHTLNKFGASDVKMIQTRNEPFIPRLVKLPFMLGALALLKGRK